MKLAHRLNQRVAPRKVSFATDLQMISNHRIVFIDRKINGGLRNSFDSLVFRQRREALVVMARVPSDMRGKSRLTRDLAGDHVELRRALLQDTLDVVEGVAGVDVFIAFEPADAIAEMRGLVGDGVRLFPQQGDTLGERMRNAFERLFAAGYSGIVMIGSDLPSLPASHLADAFHFVRERPDAVVIGPASDGGYYLIGMRRLCPELFTSSTWSTSDVLATTTCIAESSGLTVSFISPWHDVDTIDDLRWKPR